MKRQFLNLGMQPSANAFLRDDQLSEETLFSLRMGYDSKTSLVSLMEFRDKSSLFHEEYVYISSASRTMRDHFSKAALEFSARFDPKTVLEIGSNDGVFIDNFADRNTVAIEPCENFAEMTRGKGHDTISDFWNMSTAEEVLQRYDTIDLVFAANSLSHIPEIDEAIRSVARVLSDEGIFIVESPSLLNVMKNVAYDQVYDEHAHILSVTALAALFSDSDLEIFDVENIAVHGGSLRVFAQKAGANNGTPNSYDNVASAISEEQSYGLDSYDAYVQFGLDVERSRDELSSLLRSLKAAGNKIVAYGATAKSSVVFNYCEIGPDIIDYISDTTPCKQNKMSPGVHIPVIPPYDGGIPKDVNYAFLGAWNYESEIMEKEQDFVARGGRFITHIPSVRITP